MLIDPLPAPRAAIAAELGSGGPPFPDDPKTLTLADLHTAPEVFQMRHALISLTRFDQTVTALLQLIRQGIKPDRVRVWWSGARWIVLAGHHRLEAYQADAAGRGTSEGAYSVPVAVFSGTVEEAILEAGWENSKVRNPTAAAERQEWAWRLKASGVRRQASGVEPRALALSTATGISRTQADRMRKRKAELTALGVTPADMAARGWHGCRTDGDKRMMDPEDVEAFKAKMEETADRLEKALTKEFGGTWHRNAAAFAYAFATRAPPVRQDAGGQRRPLATGSKSAACGAGCRSGGSRRTGRPCEAEQRGDR